MYISLSSVDLSRVRPGGRTLFLFLSAAGEPTISMTALLELLKDADPEMKAKLRLALLT